MDYLDKWPASLNKFPRNWFLYDMISWEHHDALHVSNNWLIITVQTVKCKGVNFEENSQHVTSNIQALISTTQYSKKDTSCSKTFFSMIGHIDSSKSKIVYWILYWIYFLLCNFQSTNFLSSNFQSTNFQSSNFQSTNFQSTNFQSSNFQSSNFQSTNFQSTKFQSTNFQSTNFQSSNFQSTNFQSTNFHSTNF